MVRTFSGTDVFDGDTGVMQGTISNEYSGYSPAIVAVPERRETWMVESFCSRAVRGERSEVLTVVDMTSLTPRAEIDIPDRAAALGVRNHIGLLDDQRHLVVFNQTPAQLVTFVDTVERRFVGEIATPGCAVIMPAGERAFLMIFADGRLQLIELDASGKEAKRTQSATFFAVEEDAVFDQPMKTATGWVPVSREGLVYEVGVESGKIRIAGPWSMLPKEELPAREGEPMWRTGGKQVFTIHRATGLLYALMHEGKSDSHGVNGIEVWVVDLARQRRVGRLELGEPASHILASQEKRPKLYVHDAERKLHIYDVLRLRKLRTIEEPGFGVSMLQALARHD
jgi:methylamine dehydrogenase heavy chain